MVLRFYMNAVRVVRTKLEQREYETETNITVGGLEDGENSGWKLICRKNKG